MLLTTCVLSLHGALTDLYSHNFATFTRKHQPILVSIAEKKKMPNIFTVTQLLPVTNLEYVH